MALPGNASGKPQILHLSLWTEDAEKACGVGGGGIIERYFMSVAVEESIEKRNRPEQGVCCYIGRKAEMHVGEVGVAAFGENDQGIYAGGIFQHEGLFGCAVTLPYRIGQRSRCRRVAEET